MSSHRRRWKPGSRCIICGEKIFACQRFNYDHLIPIAKGGPRGRSNKYLSHVICNSVKGSQWPFWLRDSLDRTRLKPLVTAHTWMLLSRVWAGQSDYPGEDESYRPNS